VPYPSLSPHSGARLVPILCALRVSALRFLVRLLEFLRLGAAKHKTLSFVFNSLRTLLQLGGGGGYPSTLHSRPGMSPIPADYRSCRSAGPIAPRKGTIRPLSMVYSAPSQVIRLDAKLASHTTK
jgi:hypothetical protein